MGIGIGVATRAALAEIGVDEMMLWAEAASLDQSDRIAAAAEL